MTELLPCPFCGSEDVRVGWTDFDSGVIFVECEACGMYCEPKDCYANEPKAIAEWNSRAERTCHIEGRYGNQYCTCCGEMVGTWDSTSELYVSGNMVELWNYCPNCGAKVVSE
jgi:Lar family restriction alleviation protein